MDDRIVNATNDVPESGFDMASFNLMSYKSNILEEGNESSPM